MVRYLLRITKPCIKVNYVESVRRLNFTLLSQEGWCYWCRLLKNTVRPFCWNTFVGSQKARSFVLVSNEFLFYIKTDSQICLMLFMHLPSNVPHAECVGDAAAPSKKNMKLFFSIFCFKLNFHHKQWGGWQFVFYKCSCQRM